VSASASAARQQLDRAFPFESLDLTSPVLIVEFLASVRFWLLIALLLAFSSVWVLQGDLLFPYVLLPIIAFFYFSASYLTRHPDRYVLLAWVWLLIAACAAASPFAFVAFWRSVKRDFSFELLLPLAVVILFFLICWRTLRGRETMSDQPEPAHFMTLGLGASAPSVETPGGIKAWLAGGYRSIVVLAHAWVLATGIMQAKAIPCCIYLAIAIACGLAIPWFLFPVYRSLTNDSAVALLDAVARNRAQHKARHRFSSFSAFAAFHALRSPSALMWFLSAAVLVGAAAVLYAQSAGIVRFGFADESIRSLTGILALASVATAFFCQRLCKRHAMQHAAAQALADKSDFSVYLRSFIDDQVEVLRDGLFFRVWFVDPLFNAIRLLRFEEILVPLAWRFGRVVALERPGEALPEAGALRLSPSAPDQWQEFVVSLVAKAKLVLMTVGFTSGLRWEFRHLVTSADSEKLVLVLLPDSKESMLSTWRQFSADAALEVSCPDDILTRCLAIRFTGQGGNPIFLTSARPSTSAFWCALNACWLSPDSLPQPGREALTPARGPLKAVAWVAALASTIFLCLTAYGSNATKADAMFRRPLLARAVGGDLSAMFDVGYSYQHQADPCYWRARQWLLKAAAGGSTNAMDELGRIYEQGEGVAPSIGKARRWYKQAAELGDYAADTYLEMLTSRERQLDWEKAAAAGDVSAMFKLGNASEAAGDRERAQQWYQKAAAHGYAAAMFQMGEFYWNGAGDAADLLQAREWYEEAALRGHAGAALKLALMYQQGLADAPDVQLARQWYEKAAALGNPTAMLALGLLYQNGEGVPQDYPRARTLYERCFSAKEQACRGRADCGRGTGGFGTRRESSEDRELSQAVRSAAVATYHLGVMYYYGLGVERNYRWALHWFGESADQGDAEAMTVIADMYEKGYGVPQDHTEALMWRDKAAR